MLGTNRAAAVVGSGCSLAEDTDLRAGTTRHYTLSATAAEAGKVTCTITVGTASRTITIDFAPPTPTTSMPEPTGGELAAPGGLGCTWHTQGSERVECTWDAATGATAGYAVEYELTLNLRGTTRKYASQKTTTRTEFSGGMNKYVAKARYRVAAKGPGGTGPFTEWAAVARPGPAPRNLEVECRADARVYVSWDPVTKASRYTAAVTSTPPPAPAAVSLTSTEHLAPPNPGARPPASFNFAGQPNWSYVVQLTAEASGTASLPATASASCTPVAPPAPTGVTASCANRALTVTWEPAGAGLAEATAYKPRIFTGANTAPDTRWTANAPSSATTAAIPAQGEPDLPDTGVFQVKVKASNTAGDSGWSEAAAVTCTMPEKPGGLECAAIAENRITIGWDSVPGADGYRYGAVIRGTADVDRLEATDGDDFPDSSAPASGVSLDLGTEGQYELWVWAYNNNGRSGTASVDCDTISDTWLKAECSANGVLSAEWSDPSGGLPKPSGYRAVVYNDDPERGRVAVHTHSGTGTEMAKPLAFGKAYEVSLTSMNGNGGPVYSQTNTTTCPAHTDNWNSPNFYDPDEDCNSNTRLVGWIKNAFCRIGESQSQIAESYQELLGLKPALIDVDPVLLSRTCDTTVPNRRTCRETWSENIILLKNPGIDWGALRITDWSGPEEVLVNVSTLAGLVGILAPVSWPWTMIAVAGSGAGSAAQVLAYKRDAAAKEYVRLYPVKAAAEADAVGTSLDVVDIENLQGCLSEYDLSPRMDTITVTNIYGTFTDERISTYHHCLPVQKPSNG